MKWFLDLTTRGKLFVSFGLIFALMAWVIATAYSGIVTIRESQERLYKEDFASVRELMVLRANQNQIRALMLEAQLLTKRTEQEPLLAQAADRSKQIDRIIAVLLEREENDPRRLSQLEELKSVWQAYAQTKDAEIIPLILAGKIAEAQQLASGVQQGRQQKIRAIAEELGKAADEDARLAVAHADQQANQSFRIFLFVGIAAVVIGIALALLMERVIAGPLRALSRAADRVASGDLTVDVPQDDRADEVGNLVRMFRTMLESQRRVTREILEGVNVLSASSSEIMATTTQVASGAAETASAVSETTATVEEVKQTAQVSSQKAKYVSESAQKVSQVSQAGRKSVDSAIQGMQRVQEQMESIAGSIVQLSEQSQAIGEIIATVNDLAEQSNLLAVNAAIEAAKAGEQGKGFGVVAQEIKSLAEQSRQATAQVRTILSEIQKATGAAVMATEQGSKAVEAGVKQSTEAGESIRLLAEGVAESAQAAIQIAASSQQQMV
ncbi:MAG: methyl-accepting chemotaxis protein, partial [Burkholderiales bacterium]|nr:methyl-accepting chemotaxis protein [Burkholderiales bacterium]